MIKPEDLKVGDILIMDFGGKAAEITVKNIDFERQQFTVTRTYELEPAPFAFLSKLRRK